MTLKTVTYEQVLAMKPCWLTTPAGRRRLKRYADRLGGKATALDILRLNRIPADDRLWITLREDFIPAQVLHEFACRCAERALARIDNPDPRSVAAVEAKRQWLAGNITDEELTRAKSAAWDAAWHAARVCAQDAAWHAAHDAERKAQIEMLIEMLLEAQL